MKSILPQNATPLMRAMEEVAEESFCALRVQYSNFWNPEKCPAEFLPYLAWMVQVFLWDNEWTEKQKRDVIKWTIELRKIRGTVGCLRKGLDALNVRVDVVPWWKDKSSFDIEKDKETRVFVSINENLEEGKATVDAKKIKLIRDLVDSLKPLKVRYDYYYKVDFDPEIRVACCVRPMVVFKAQAEIEIPGGL